MKLRLMAMTLTAVTFMSVTGLAQAAFIPSDNEPNTGEFKFFINGANKDVSDFSGLVGSNNSGPTVNVHTIGNVDTGNGYANIKPIKDGSLTDLIFTPENDKLFSDFFFRGQLLDDGDITLKVTDAQGDPTQIFTFANIKANADFGALGFLLDMAFPNDKRTIKTVELLSEGFKEVKQIDFSYAVAPVPLPGSFVLFGVGLIALGAVAASKQRRAGSLC